MAELQDFKCPNCGGAVVFDGSEQQMRCTMCSTVYSPEAFELSEDALRTEAPDEIEWDHSEQMTFGAEEAGQINSYVCQSCGGQIMGDATLGSTACPFCDNPVVIPTQFSGDIRPDLLIPFSVSREQAVAALDRHINSKRFVPKVFKDKNHIEEVKGLYVPFWLFDAKANASIRYRATNIRRWSDRKYNYVETTHYSAVREGALNFTMIPVDGSTKMPDDMMESIEPYDTSQAIPFNTAYLSGFLADRYDVDSESSEPRANDRLKKSTEAAFMSTVQGYQQVVPVSSSIQLTEGKVRYALYPVWMLNTVWNDQRFVFAVNGQTGKIAGNLPLDKRAYRRWFLALFVALSAVIYLIAWLLR